jgi:acetyltransferase
MIVRPHGRELIVGVIRIGLARDHGRHGRQGGRVPRRAVALPPLNAFRQGHDCRTRVSALGAFARMPAADMQALESVLPASRRWCASCRRSRVRDQPAHRGRKRRGRGPTRAVVRDAQRSRSRYAHMAIHPYPTDLVAK